MSERSCIACTYSNLPDARVCSMCDAPLVFSCEKCGYDTVVTEECANCRAEHLAALEGALDSAAAAFGPVSAASSTVLSPAPIAVSTSAVSSTTNGPPFSVSSVSPSTTNPFSRTTAFTNPPSIFGSSPATSTTGSTYSTSLKFPPTTPPRGLSPARVAVAKPAVAASPGPVVIHAAAESGPESERALPPRSLTKQESLGWLDFSGAKAQLENSPTTTTASPTFTAPVRPATTSSSGGLFGFFRSQPKTTTTTTPATASPVAPTTSAGSSTFFATTAATSATNSFPTTDSQTPSRSFPTTTARSPPATVRRLPSPAKTATTLFPTSESPPSGDDWFGTTLSSSASSTKKPSAAPSSLFSDEPPILQSSSSRTTSLMSAFESARKASYSLSQSSHLDPVSIHSSGSTQTTTTSSKSSFPRPRDDSPERWLDPEPSEFSAITGPRTTTSAPPYSWLNAERAPPARASSTTTAPAFIPARPIAPAAADSAASRTDVYISNIPGDVVANDLQTELLQWASEFFLGFEFFENFHTAIVTILYEFEAERMEQEGFVFRGEVLPVSRVSPRKSVYVFHREPVDVGVLRQAFTTMFCKGENQNQTEVVEGKQSSACHLFTEIVCEQLREADAAVHRKFQVENKDVEVFGWICPFFLDNVAEGTTEGVIKGLFAEQCLENRTIAARVVHVELTPYGSATVVVGGSQQYENASAWLLGQSVWNGEDEMRVVDAIRKKVLLCDLPPDMETHTIKTQFKTTSSITIYGSMAVLEYENDASMADVSSWMEREMCPRINKCACRLTPFDAAKVTLAVSSSKFFTSLLADPTAPKTELDQFNDHHKILYAQWDAVSCRNFFSKASARTEENKANARREENKVVQENKAREAPGQAPTLDKTATPTKLPATPQANTPAAEPAEDKVNTPAEARQDLSGRLRVVVQAATRGACLRSKYSSESEKIVKLKLADVKSARKVYSDTSRMTLPQAFRTGAQTVVQVKHADALEQMKELLGRRFHPLLVNVTTSVAGGEFRTGGAGQQEDIFRRSDLYRFLVPDDDPPPLIDAFGGIYAKGVTVFRGSEQKGFPFLEEKDVFTVDLLSVLGSRPAEKKEQLTDQEALTIQRAMHSMAKIAIEQGHDSLVLPAWGCSFPLDNEPRDIARLVKEMIRAFYGCFREIIVAVNSPDHFDAFRLELDTNFERRQVSHQAMLTHFAGTLADSLCGRVGCEEVAHAKHSILCPSVAVTCLPCPDAADSIHKLCFWHMKECADGLRCQLKEQANHRLLFLHVEQGSGSAWICGLCSSENQNFVSVCHSCHARRSLLEKKESVAAIRQSERGNLPSYWQLKDLKSVVRVDVTHELKQIVQTMIDSTSIQKHIGIGRDSHGFKHKGFLVTKVERVENPYVWLRYDLERERVRRAYTKDQKRPLLPVATTNEKLWRDIGIDEEIRERLLFHGTKPGNVVAMISGGMDERYSSPDGLFGRGIYLAENSSKADEYTRPDAQKNHYFFLVRAILGWPHVTTKAMKNINNAPPNPAIPVQPDQPPTHHDSVLAECQETYKNSEFEAVRTGPKPELVRYREFVAYARERCYPEFLVTFQWIM